MGRKKTDAGRQALENGTRLGLPGGAASSASYHEEPASWVCLLQGLSGKPMRLRIGRKSFRLSSDTIYFLEEIAPGSPADGRGGVRPDRGSAESFIYVCGSLEGLSRTLGDLQKAARGEAFRTEGSLVLHGLGN